MNDHAVTRAIFKEYTEKYPESNRLHQDCMKYMPAGTTRSLSYFKPYPLHIASGKGAYVYTHEGHALLDVTNSYGATVHGHGDPDFKKAVVNSMEKGVQFSAPTEAQHSFARLLCERIPSFDRVRFCNSGTEATLFALRTARAYTGKNKIMKMTGGFHGTHDCVATSTKKNTVVMGIPPGMSADVVEVKYNDLEDFETTFKKVHKELACVIIEPFLGAGGIILPREGLLELVRELTRKHGVLLLFDEIFSLRIHYGGAQSYYNVIPDITAAGKVIGGGLPVGVFGGKEEIMNIYCQVTTEKPLYHSGTFNGYETVMSTGIATLEKLDHDAIADLNAMGDNLKADLDQIIRAKGLCLQVNQIGSLLNVHFARDEVTNNEAVLQTPDELQAWLHLSLLNKGVYPTPRGLFILSTPMGKEEMDLFTSAMDEALAQLKPYIQDKYPHLLL